MILAPQSPEQWSLLARYLAERVGIVPSADLKLMAWVEPNKGDADKGEIKMVVGFNGFLGRVCQMHVAMEPGFHFTPKAMLRECFAFAFENCDRVIGVVNSNNEAAMKYDLHLGFKELYRMPELHDDGGDIVILGMDQKDCKWLAKPEARILLPQAHQAGALTH